MTCAAVFLPHVANMLCESWLWARPSVAALDAAKVRA